MSEATTTYDLAAPYLEPYVQVLWPGALAMPFETRDQDGRRLNARRDMSYHRATVPALTVYP